MFVAIVAALYLLVFFTGNRSPTPKLGIDLQGGTRVTLTARTPNGAPPSAESLTLARTIIQNRVNGIGVSRSEVVISGQNLVITVLAVGQVQGFAFTLGMSTVLDLLVVFLVTHPLVALASRSDFLSHPGRIGLGGVQQIAKQRTRNHTAKPPAS